MNDRMRQFLVLFFTIGQAVAGYLSNALLEPNVGEISDGFENYFTPAGITFAVWGYLYLAMIAYGIYQALPAQRERTIHRRIGGWVALATAASTAWPVVWPMTGIYGTPSFQIMPLVFSVVLIVVLTFALAVATRRLRSVNETMTGQDRWLVALPTLSYLAWASVATIANVTTLLIGLGWNPGSQGAFWSAAMIVVATLIVLAVIFDGRSRVGLVGFAAVILWALVGIYLGNNDKSALVGTTALVATGVVALFGAWRLYSLPANSQHVVA